MKRLDQSHLYPNVEVARLTWHGRESDPGPPLWEAITLEKSQSNSFLIATVIRNIYLSAAAIYYNYYFYCGYKVAKVMNKHFVNIKMDREERPDVDKVYMTFVQVF
jgi:hypothetical protein